MPVPGIPPGAPWPEDWPIPNYTNPPIRGNPALFIFTLAFTGIVVALRLYSRFYLTRSPGIDDIFLVAGFVFSLGQTYVEYKNLTTWGWNKHLWDVPITDHEHVRLGAWLLELFFLLGIGCTKISILFVYRRISNGSSNMYFIRLTWAAITFTIAYVLALTLYLFLICHPMEAYWKSYSPTYTKSFKCGDERVPILLSVILNVVSDIYATALPMFLVRKLRLSRKQRIGLVVLFSVGILTIGTGAVRIYFLEIVTTNYKPGLHTHDVTWPGWPLYAWTDIEAHLAIICASAPALKVFFTQKLKSLLTGAWTASKRTLALSRSRTSSAKALISLPISNSRRNNVPLGHDMSNHGDAQQFGIEIIHNPTKDLTEAYRQDVEKFPLEQIVSFGAEKPLPTLPTDSWSEAKPSSPIPATLWSSSISNPGDDASSSVSVDAGGGSQTSSGEFLPIYVSSSLPPITRRG